MCAQQRAAGPEQLEGGQINVLQAWCVKNFDVSLASVKPHISFVVIWQAKEEKPIFTLVLTGHSYFSVFLAEACFILSIYFMTTYAEIKSTEEKCALQKTFPLHRSEEGQLVFVQDTEAGTDR